MNQDDPRPTPFLEYVARYAEEFGNHAWAAILRRRIGTGAKSQSQRTDRKKLPDRSTDT